MARTENVMAVFSTWLIGCGLFSMIVGPMLGCSTVPQNVIDALTNSIPGAVSNAVDGGSVPTTTTTTTTTTVPPVAAGAYDLTLKVTSLSTSKVGFEWSPKAYNWPSKTVKVLVDAEVAMYRADGSGGKFDWIRAGGQKSKGLENIHGGYGCWKQVGLPQPGEQVTFRWTDIHGNKRSNDAVAVWPAKRWWRFWE